MLYNPVVHAYAIVTHDSAFYYVNKAKVDLKVPFISASKTFQLDYVEDGSSQHWLSSSVGSVRVWDVASLVGWGII